MIRVTVSEKPQLTIAVFNYPPEIDAINARIDELEIEGGKQVELQKSSTHIQWRYVGDVDWINLVALIDLEGADGNDGAEVEFQKSATHIQWRYVGDADWINLVALADIKGDTGATPDLTIVFNDQADNYAILAEDKNKHIRMQKATASNLTINDVLAQGESLTVEQNNDGQVTFVADAGVTIKSADSMVKTRVKYSGATIIKTPTAGEYELFGDLTE